MIGFGRCNVSPILGVEGGLPNPLPLLHSQNIFLKLTLGATTFFCVLMIPFNEEKNKQACRTDIMVALLAPALYSSICGKYFL